MTGLLGSTGSMPSETWSRKQARHLARHVNYHLATWANDFWSISWSEMTIKYILELKEKASIEKEKKFKRFTVNYQAMKLNSLLGNKRK